MGGDKMMENSRFERNVYAINAGKIGKLEIPGIGGNDGKLVGWGVEN